MNNITEFLKNIENLMNPTQLETLKKLTSNPNNMNIQQAQKILSDLGIDQKKLKGLLGMNKKKTKKVGENDLCICNSGKKYKKCCKNKN